MTRRECKDTLALVKPVILVVSFGTSYNNSRKTAIDAIEKTIDETFADYEVRRAFTSRTIINRLKKHEGIEIDGVVQAFDRLIADNVNDVIIQPTHIMRGEEYYEMLEEIKPYELKFTSVKYGKPLLSSTEDYEKVIEAVAAETPQLRDKSNAVVFVGHGTQHYADNVYSKLDICFKAMGFNNAFVGTVYACDINKVKDDLKIFGAVKVTVIPFMIVAGSHAYKDIFGNREGSWTAELKKEGYRVECINKGLGEYHGIRKIFAKHIQEVIDENKEV